VKFGVAASEKTSLEVSVAIRKSVRVILANAGVASRWPGIGFVRICAKRRTKASTGQRSG